LKTKLHRTCGKTEGINVLILVHDSNQYLDICCGPPWRHTGKDKVRSIDPVKFKLYLIQCTVRAVIYLALTGDVMSESPETSHTPPGSTSTPLPTTSSIIICPLTSSPIAKSAFI